MIFLFYPHIVNIKPYLKKKHMKKTSEIRVNPNKV